MKKICGLTLLAVLMFSFCAEHASAQNKKRPNMILILTDDLGWSSFSAKMDDRIPESKSDFHETPQIENFAKQSLRFTRGYAPDPICTPSRRSIQFGQTSIHQGDETFPNQYKPGTNNAKSIPQMLKSIDPHYKTAHFGKWDLRAGISPEQLGYDESDGDTGNKDGDMVKDKEEKWTQHYISDNPKQIDSITYRSIHFLEQEVKQKHPFYLQVSHYATHVNFETKKQSYEKFLSKEKGKKHDNPAWAGMIYDLDAAIGVLLKKVKDLGIEDNTYIFLMADNGGVEFIAPVSNRLDPPSAFSHQMRNYPLRGGKWTLYEGGIRVPFMVKGPGIKAGVQSDVPVAGWDLLPTIAELAGGKEQHGETVDGGSLVTLMKNEGKGKVVRASGDFFFHRYNNGYPHSAIISGDYKLIRFWKTNKLEMYNIKNDLGETDDVSSREPEKVKELDARLMKYIQENNPEIATRYKQKSK